MEIFKSCRICNEIVWNFSKAAGFESKPNRNSLYPVGFLQNPVGLLSIPSGFIYNPSCFAFYPACLFIKPTGKIFYLNGNPAYSF